MSLALAAAAVVNLVVGAIVGLCGVAGFLLPMFYVGSLSMGVAESLALSFAAFIVSGVLGSISYRKAGNLDIPFGIRLSVGSLAGALLGVKLNLIIPEAQVKVILYLVVLLSGISILLRKDKKSSSEPGGHEGAKKEKGLLGNLPLTLLLGFVTGIICSLSGAGGPVLVMPLLVVLGMPIRTAVGVALFNSIFIGIPAAVGYLTQCDIGAVLPFLAAALVSHGIGVFYGSRMAVKVNQTLLKRGVAVFSILLSIGKLTGIM
ncbi:MAG: sulfite exporter TauE/SafE family protein [Eubacteriales bacterium]|nr:sulfite exporter TauE/SafE family protein [Eubacteriales bacterium]